MGGDGTVHPSKWYTATIVGKKGDDTYMVGLEENVEPIPIGKIRPPESEPTNPNASYRVRFLDGSECDLPSQQLRLDDEVDPYPDHPCSCDKGRLMTMVAAN